MILRMNIFFFLTFYKTIFLPSLLFFNPLFTIFIISMRCSAIDKSQNIFYKTIWLFFRWFFFNHDVMTRIFLMNKLSSMWTNKVNSRMFNSLSLLSVLASSKMLKQWCRFYFLRYLLILTIRLSLKPWVNVILSWDSNNSLRFFVILFFGEILHVSLNVADKKYLN